MPATIDLVLLRELVDAEDRDDVLQVLVALEDLRTGHCVVLLADVARVEDPRRGVQRVHGRVDAEGGDVAREHGGRVEVRERRVRRRVGDVVGRHVDRLQRRDRAASGRGDPLLQVAHLAGEVRLVPRRSACGRAGSRPPNPPGEPEDVVHEQQHVEVLLVAEVLSHRERRQRHTQPHARGSSIWPKTSAVFSITPDSVISMKRSLPSRVRSPTPAKTETPPCCSAWRRIISWMITVLPTPAPPNMPILPPCTYGSSRSITLMPVSSITFFGSRSANGAHRGGSASRCRD